MSALPRVLNLLQDQSWEVRQAVVAFFSTLLNYGKHPCKFLITNIVLRRSPEKFHRSISAALPGIINLLEDQYIRKDAVNFFSKLLYHSKFAMLYWAILTRCIDEFHSTISIALPRLRLLLDNHDGDSRDAVDNFFSELSSHGKSLASSCFTDVITLDLQRNSMALSQLFFQELSSSYKIRTTISDSQ